MAIKIEIIQSSPNNPPLLIINDSDVYPIVDIIFKGKTDKQNPSFDEPFSLINGTLFFVDIFNQPHYYINMDIDEHLEIDPATNCWNKRMDAMNNSLTTHGKEPEKNPLKLMPPWQWSQIPEEDWPAWMNN